MQTFLSTPFLYIHLKLLGKTSTSTILPTVQDFQPSPFKNGGLSGVNKIWHVTWKGYRHVSEYDAVFIFRMHKF